MKRLTFNSYGALLRPIQLWLESIEIGNPETARLLCKLIPARCPFEQEIKVLNRTLIRIPPLCKLNPFYEQALMLRFKSLTYLADHCGEDVTVYCQ